MGSLFGEGMWMSLLVFVLGFWMSLLVLVVGRCDEWTLSMFSFVEGGDGGGVVTMPIALSRLDLNSMRSGESGESVESTDNGETTGVGKIDSREVTSLLMLLLYRTGIFFFLCGLNWNGDCEQ